MDSLSGIGTTTSGAEISRIGRPGSAKESASAGTFGAGAATAKAIGSGAVGGGVQSPVRPSLLVALQEVRMNAPEDEETADETKSGAAGLFATGEPEDETASVIDEIMEKGLAEWAHEQWLERIREKARQTALAGMGMSEEDVAALPPEMQAQVERLIKEAVDEAVRRATEQAAEQNGEERTNQAKVLSPIVTGG